MTYEPSWIEMPGVVNMRDLGGHTTRDGRTVKRARVLRSDNLGDLPPESLAILRDDYQLTDVIDLRTNRERKQAGPTPLNGLVNEHLLSLYPEDDPDAPLPPWASNMSTTNHEDFEEHAESTANHYMEYLDLRADSLLQALRVVARAQGATIVHCAAGKDRTGTTCAIMLAAVGVPEDQVVADYGASDEKIVAILTRLGSAASWGSADHSMEIKAQSTPPIIMEKVIAKTRERYGSLAEYLAANGWTADDQDALEAALLD